MSGGTVPLSYFGETAVDHYRRFPVGTRVRYHRARGDFFTKTPRDGEGTVSLIWNCMGELAWEIEPPLRVDPQSFVPIKQDRVAIIPSLGDTLTVRAPSQPDASADKQTHPDASASSAHKDPAP